MAGDDDTMATDDTGVVAQAPAPDAIAIPLVLLPGNNPDPLLNLNDFRAVVADLSYTILDPAPIWRYWRILFPLLLSSLLCLATQSQANRICILLLWWHHREAVVVAPLDAPIVELAS